MSRMLLAVLMGVCASACPADDAPAPGDEPSTSAPSDATTTHGPPADATATEGSGPPPGTTAETSEPDAWLELGWGISEFNAFEGVLPVTVGPQGLSMFSLPLRGKGFHNPPDAGFDNPEVPILQAWVDVDGHDESPGGHLSEVVDYPALFYPSQQEPNVLVGPAVWLVIPDTVDPSTLVGRRAQLHAELVDTDGLVLTDDHTLVIGEDPPAPDGP